MPLPSGFLDELRSRTALPSLIGRRVRLARSGRQWKGCCPFHNEKTPSFIVYEDGYHCFGCGAHGDAIGFVMQSQGLGFTEAVAQLAAEAGLTVPKPTPEAAAAEQRRLDVVGVLEAARTHYQRRLQLPEGHAAREYLSGRGVTAETLARFGLGWTGERGALGAELGRSGGISEDLLLQAGLIRRDEATGRVFELFSQRVMFPILDRRGMIISFGGRTLGTGQPKYVNGPDTALFSKRRNLYGLNLAREAVRNGAVLLVVEGYMDVIIASQAGFEGAVAPLGTALTGEQLDALWAVSPMPVLCFDGDAAGGRAAARAMDVALPMLMPERSLKFATLPADEDPDSLVRRQDGVNALQNVLDAARTPEDALYDMLLTNTGEGTAAQRAALLVGLDKASDRIADKVQAAEFRRAVRDRFYAERRLKSQQGRSRQGGFARAPGVARLPRPVPRHEQGDAERVRFLVAILLRHPFLLHDVAQAFSSLVLPPDLVPLRAALEAWADSAETLDSLTLLDHLTKSGFQASVQHVLAAKPSPLPLCASEGAMPAEAEAGWWHFFAFLNVDHLREEVALAQANAARNMTADTLRRQMALVQALRKVTSGEPDGGGVDA